MLALHTSNRLEALAEALAALMRSPLRSPLEPEVIVVQSQGMARWLKLQLAQHHGICSNCQFPFPRAFSYETFSAVLPSVEVKAAYDPEVLVWRILTELPRLLEDPAFAPLQNYLSGKSDGRKRVQLAQQIAHLFDQYLVFRPELILEWDGGAGADWQARLWREISGPFRGQHPAALQTQFLEHLNQANAPTTKLPERVAVFGISALPPFYLQVLTALSRQVQVHLFLLEPCQEFWGYISSAREQQRTLERSGRGAAEAETLHLEGGNRLLASMGQLGRDFLLLVQGAGDWEESDSSLFADPGEDRLLACIQSDILHLRDGGAEELGRRVLSSEDDSVQVHSCHSPLRELEVLYDHLLSWFEKDPTLAPRDILVMIPEIERYAPLIHAVFDSPEREDLRIPFSLADRTTRTQSHVIESFLAILNLADARLGASQVLALLDSAPIREKFQLAEPDLELIRHWVEEVRIRWGRDEAQRVGLDLPAWSENTWRHGLQQLLLGYAMAGKGAALFERILPYDDIEGDAAAVLGKFAEFVETLFATLVELAQPRRLEQWVEVLQSMLERFFALADVQAPEVLVLHSCLDKLRRAATQSGFAEDIPLAMVLEELTPALSEDHFGAGFLTGGVTFCALKPMRSIPARVICLLGMNDRAFPRASAQLSFDLMSEQPRLGDRSSREDDRYLFLETLISARDRLYLSYVGQSIRDNSIAPPSVLISELLEYIGQSFEVPGKDILTDHIQTRHRLQAFSPAYFTRSRLFSYSRENLHASQAMQPERKTPPMFVPRPLGEPEAEWRLLTLPMLADFLCHPARFLARRRLGLELLPPSTELEETEPFEIDGLDRYGLEQELLELRLAGLELAGAQDLVRASGRLPASMAGTAQYAQVCTNVNKFHLRLEPFVTGGFGVPVPFEVLAEPFRISGQFSRVTAGGLVFYRPAEIKGTDLIRAWLEHLFWNLCDRQGKPAESVLLGTKSVRKMRPVPEPREVLRRLLGLYWRGLCQPLRFFPRTSFAFAAAEDKVRDGTAGRVKNTPLHFAEQAWFGVEFGPPGECNDEYFSLFFGDEPPLDEEFMEHARTVFHPLLQHSTEEKL